MTADTASGGDGTVGKALQVLDMVASAPRPPRFTDLLATSAFPRATLFRLLQSLTHQGMLTHDPQSGTYGLGLRLVRLAHGAWASASLAPIARPYLDALSLETGETLHLAQLDMGQVLYVDKRNAARPVAMFSSAGKVAPAYCTGVGKAILAHLEPDALQAALAQQSFHRYTPQTLTSAEDLRRDLAETALRGFALDREEHEAGIICCAAPILRQSGQVLGALSITSTTMRGSLAALTALAPRLMACAAGIAGAAESWHFPSHSPKAP
jgi:IclR family transcriptional regulator, KDG regulon repressor